MDAARGRHEAGHDLCPDPVDGPDHDGSIDRERSSQFRLAALETDFRSHRDHITHKIDRLENWLMNALEDLQAQVSALVAEDGIVIAEMQKLQDRGDAVSAADVQAAADTIKGEVAKLAAAAADGTGSGPTDPAAPADPSAPAAPVDGSAPVDGTPPTS